MPENGGAYISVTKMSWKIILVLKHKLWVFYAFRLTLFRESPEIDFDAFTLLPVTNERGLFKMT